MSWWPFSSPSMADYNPPEQKDSSARQAEVQSTAGLTTGGTAGIPRPDEGKTQTYLTTIEICSIVYQVMRRVTAAVAEPGWIVTIDGEVQSDDGEDGVEPHEVVKLLSKPNNLMGRQKFFESLAGDYFTLGSFAAVRTESITNNNSILELWPVLAGITRPQVDRATGRLISYVVGGDLGEAKRDYPIDPITGDCQLIFSSNYNPKSLWHGLAGFPAAWNAIQQYLGYERYNYSQLNNGSDLAGIVRGQGGQSLTAQQGQDLTNAISSARGPANAGKFIVTNAPVDISRFDRTPAEMNFLEGRGAMAREIAQTLGCPALLLGLPGDNTFNNYAEARIAFTEDTIIPHYLTPMGSELGRWMSIFYDQRIELTPDLDGISALIPKRMEMMKSVDSVKFLTINEKRDWFGYDSVPGGDTPIVGTSDIPLDMIGLNEATPVAGSPTVAPAAAKASPGLKLVSGDL